MRLLGHRYYIMVSPSSTASTASENKSEKGVWFSLRYRFESLRFAATFLKPCRISRSWDGSKHLAVTVFINAAAITTERREKIGGIITSTMIDVFWARNRGTSSPTPVHPRFNEREIKPGYSEELAIFNFFSKECFRRSGPRRSAEAFSRSRASNANIAAKYRTERSHATAISPFQMNQKVASQNFLKKPRERASLAAKITKPRCEIL